MECFIPCQKVQSNDWKPAVRTAFFPGLLGLTLVIFGLGNYSSHVPFGRPAGVINKHGVCYLASAIQMLGAVKFALGTGFEAVFQPKGGLLEAYNEIYEAGHDFSGVPSCIDPDKLVKKWVGFNSAKYNRPFIVKQVRQHDGSMTKEELFPQRIGNGSGGSVAEVFELITNEIEGHCKESGIANPLRIVLQTDRRSGQKNTLNGLLYIPLAKHHTANNAMVLLEDGVVTTQLNVVKAPRLLTIVPNDVALHHVPLQVSFKDANGIVGTYRLLAAAYGLPMIKEDKGFVGNHAIAVVRYGDKWYECDNHHVVAFASEADVTTWIDEAARTTYQGSGMSAGAVPGKHPMLSIYELVGE